MTLTASDAAGRIGPGHVRPGRGRRRTPRGRWTPRRIAASLVLSALWHLLVIAVLALAVHPFDLPEAERAIDVTLMPPLVELRPDEPPPPLPRPTPREATPERAAPLAPALETTPEVRAQTPAPARPLDTRRPPAFELQQPQAAEAPPAPPAPVELARPAPAVLPAPLEVQRRPAPAAQPLNTSRAAPAIPAPTPAPAEAAPADAPIATQSRVPVLTNQQVIAAPIEIRPPERAATVGPRSTAPALPDIPAAPPAGAPAGGTAAPGQAGGLKPYGSASGGFDDALRRGLHMRLGCATPDTYKLTPEERAECLRRLAEEGKAAADLGINIPLAKQAEYDRFAACRDAARRAAIPSSGAASGGTSVRGLGDNPSLKACGPGTR